MLSTKARDSRAIKQNRYFCDDFAQNTIGGTMSDKILELNGFDFEKTIKESKVPVLVDFWAAWCSPCRMQAPVLNEIADELGEKILVAKVNVDESEELAIKYNVMSIPFLAVFVNGELKESTVGLTTKAELAEMLIKYM